MKRDFFLIFVYFFIGIGWVCAQTRDVSGTVFSAEDGEPIIGASVLIEGTTSGTVTDIDGKFYLKTAEGAKLQISFIGMKTVTLLAKPNMVVKLESDTEVLDEVMVVAYGTAKKSAFTGSAKVMKSEDIGKLQVTNAAEALTGKVAGVQMNTSSGQPGSSTPTIRIRGISSINAGNDPLIVLDGAPYDGDINNINPQDIESMTVLKDAASNALYGARGANGVIMITTKKGKSGDAIVTLDAKWGSNMRGTMDYSMVTNPAQYYEMYYSALKNYFMDSSKMSPANAHIAANNNMFGSGEYSLVYNVYTVPENQFLIGTNGKLNPNATLGNVVTFGDNKYLLYPDNWTDAAYKHGLRQEYNLSVSAGSDKSTFYFSLGYLGNEGITDQSNYERLTGRLKADYQAKSWLKLGANIAYNHMDINSLGSDGESGGSQNIFSYALAVAPIYPLFIRNEDGTIIRDENNFPRYDYGDKNNAGLERPIFAGSNAYSDLLLNENGSESNAINANAFFEIRFLEDFKFTWNSGVNVDETRQTMTINPYYGTTSSFNGMVHKYHIRSFSYNHQQLLNYQHTFVNVHNVGVMVGHESYRSKYYILSGSKSNMFNPSNVELDGAITVQSTGSNTSDYNSEGFFSRLQYDYDSKYFGSVSYRRDASSRFHPEHRWGNFWSLGGAWLISKEDFFDVDWVDELKYKASYGSQGNDNIGDYRYTNTYVISNSSGYPAAVPNVMGNETITWETNGNFNTGFDFSFFKGRLTGAVEMFYRKTSDMLFAFPLPPTFGYTSYYDNIGDMRNIGIEAEFNIGLIKTKDLLWDLRFNMTHYKNKVLYLPEENKTNTVDGHAGFISGLYYYGENMPLYTFYIPKYAGVSENGESLFYKDVVKDGVKTVETTTTYSEATKYLCGSSLPKLYGGFGTSLSYKGLDFSMDFTYQLGGKTYDSTYASLMQSPQTSTRGRNFHTDLLNAWSQDNKGSNIPRFQYGDVNTAQTSDRFLTDASYLSIQNINLGYTLPTTMLKALQRVRVYLSADNVFVWSKRQGLDPRQSLMGQPNGETYAPIRTISGGLTVTF